MRLLIVSDAWKPQINGVVRTLERTRAELEAVGDTVDVIGPTQFRTIPCPSYPEIRLALFARRRLEQLIDTFGPDAVHIATEGPLGQAARAICLQRGWSFTTSFHTRFPEYVKARIGLPEWVMYSFLRRFHAAATQTLVTTRTMQQRLQDRGFERLVVWSRGVDTKLFQPDEAPVLDLARPIFVTVGRVAVEKNVEAFLRLDLPGTKLVVGDGPQRPALQARYPDVVFVGAKQGQELARHYALGDVFVFPSRTDTFGLVLLEALACGVPVAAFPVEGPVDVITNTAVGVLDEDLRKACLQALDKDRAACRAHATGFSWAACASVFRSHLVGI